MIPARHARRIAASVTLAIVTAACADDPRTQLMVVIDTTLAVPAELDFVRISVTGPTGRTKTATGSLGLTRPVLVALVPADDALSPVTVVVDAAPPSGGAALSRTVRTGFVRGHVKELRVVLDETCAPTCPPIDVAGAALPDWTGNALPIDGSAPFDASSETSAPDDLGPSPRDAELDGDATPPPDDAGPDADGDAGPDLDAGPPEELFVDFVRQLVIPGGSSTELVYRMPVTPGGEPRDVSAELDAELGTVVRTDDRYLNPSPNGQWLVLSAARGDCIDWSCIYVMPAGDASRAEAVYLWMEAGWLHSEYPVVDSTGTRIVSGDNAADHPRDLIEVHRSADGWERGIVLTRESPYPFNNMPRWSPDESRVVFLCSHEVYASNDVCEVGLDGTGFRVVARHDVPPAPLAPGENESLWSPSYAPDGSIVFEAEWGHLRQIWRVGPSDTTPRRVYPAALAGFGQPCVLPDGRIASITRVDGGDPEQISIGSADGRPLFDILVPWEPGQLTFLTGCGR